MTAEGMFNPSRLTLARKRRGLTKTCLAKALGVELRSVTAFELGEYPPSMVTLGRIVSVLKFPLEFFFGEDLDEPTADVASFRAMSKMTASQRDMALGEGALALNLNRWIEERFELPPPNLPDLSREPSPEAAADSLRRYWRVGELPIRNMIHLLEANGIRVFSLSVAAREVDAFSMWNNETAFVFLNLQKSSEHSRFDAAHELGHLVLHRHATPQGREAEREADAFASAFLMPKSSVLASAPRFATLDLLVKLKKIWITSVAALNYRMHEVGLTTDWQYRNLCIQLAQRGYRLKEPDPAPRETSLILPKILASLRQEGLGRAQLAKNLDISLQDLNQLMFGLVMVGIDGGNRVVNTSVGSTKLELVRPTDN